MKLISSACASAASMNAAERILMLLEAEAIAFQDSCSFLVKFSTQ
jgi:hypothetical protein